MKSIQLHLANPVSPIGRIYFYQRMILQKQQLGQCAALSLLFACSLMSSAAVAAELSVRIDNLRSSEGNVRVGLFNSAVDFPRRQFKGEAVESNSGAVVVLFKDLPAGIYAISAYQDLNDNQKLDTNAMGRPNEPHGFSKDARGTFGPPSFDDAGFAVQEGSNVITVKLR